MIPARRLPRPFWILPCLVLFISAVAYAQVGTTTGSAKPPMLEYLHQEVKSDAVVQTLNDLSKQGWEVFQLMPNFTIKNDNGETSLSPTGYQIFGRRPLAGN